MLTMHGTRAAKSAIGRPLEAASGKLEPKVPGIKIAGKANDVPDRPGLMRV